VQARLARIREHRRLVSGQLASRAATVSRGATSQASST